jgi:hypothetical protein
MKIQNQGEWTFEIKQIFCRKTPAHGEEYCASAVITVTDGEPHLELLLNKNTDVFSRSDYRDFNRYLKNLGFKSAKFKRIKNNKSRDVTHLE